MAKIGLNLDLNYLKNYSKIQNFIVNQNKVKDFKDEEKRFKVDKDFGKNLETCNIVCQKILLQN